MQRWEYRVIPSVLAGLPAAEVERSGERLQGTLNELGAEGWILAATVAAGLFLVLRRPVERPSGS